MTRPCLLDLDGTLMPSHDVDNRCYWQAVHEVFDRPGDTVDLARFRHVTDSGILDEWCRDALGRAPADHEVRAVKARFLAQLEDAANADAAAFTPLPGVRAWLRRRPAGTVAIATGGWEHSARFKLRVAGLAKFKLPLAGSDSEHQRTAIMRRAHRLLGAAQRDRLPVYFGDGPWDLAAAGALGWGFVGVAEGPRGERLRRAGADVVVANFREAANLDF